MLNMKKLLGSILLTSLLPFAVCEAKDYVPLASNEYIVTPNVLRQVNQGWGVSLCWWANMCGKWSDSKINTLVDWLVSPKGLNYNVFKYNIGGGDDPQNRHCNAHHMETSKDAKGVRAEMEGFKDASNGSYIWTRDAAQRKIMLKIKKKRPDAVFTAFSASPPYYMTYSGCVSGNTNGSKDNLKPEYYSEFAHYLVDVCKHYKDVYGIEFKTLDPFNEPSSGCWVCNGGQEGCHFDNASQIAFLKVLKPILEASSLKTKIAASDETSVGLSLTGLKAYKSANVLDKVAQWNTHSYDGNNLERVNLSDLARSENKPLWMSETGMDGSGFKGNLQLAQLLFKDEKYIRPDVWADWQYFEAGGDQWGLVKGDFSTQWFTPKTNYYARQQITRFIKQGYIFVDALNDDVLAAVSPKKDTLVLVSLNLTDGSRTLTARLNDTQLAPGRITGYYSDGTNKLANLNVSTTKAYSADNGYSTVTYTMPKLSIVTLVIPINVCQTKDNIKSQSTTCLIIPAAAHNEALTVVNGNLCIEPVTGAAAQRWHFIDDGNSTYLLRNDNYEYILLTNSYFLSTTTQKYSAQPIKIVSNSANTYRLMTHNGMAFDLQDKKLTDGTRVGQWAFGNVGSAAHRSWLILPIATSGTATGISVPHTTPTATHYYNLEGMQLEKPSRGITILQTSDGKTRKILRK